MRDCRAVRQGHHKASVVLRRLAAAGRMHIFERVQPISELRMALVYRRFVLCALVAPALAAAQSRTTVGPSRGTVIVVGGGSMGPEIYSAFIEAAGGPDALIIDVPTAGGDTAYGQNAP